jgi:hypothetical protein
MHGKYLSVFGDYEERIEAYKEYTANVGLFAVHKTTSKNTESIKRIRRIR